MRIRLTGKSAYLAIVTLSILFYIAPLAIRWLDGNPTLPGVYGYYYLSILDDKYPLLHSIGEPYSLVLPWLISVLGAVILVSLFYRLVLLGTQNASVAFAAGALFTVSPSLLYLSSSLTPYLAGLILLFMSLNLVHTRMQAFAFLPLLGIVMFDWATAIGVFSIAASYFWHVRHKVGVAISMLLSIIFLVTRLVSPQPAVTEVFPHAGYSVELLADLGGLYGFGVFTLFLAIVGLLWAWQHKHRLAAGYLCTILLIAAYFIIGQVMLLFAFPLAALFAAGALVYFVRRRWVVPTVRFLTLALIAYGIIFSGVAYAYRIVSLPPTPAILSSGTWLGEHAFTSKMLLSHPEKGYWLEYNSGITPYVTYNDAVYGNKADTTTAIFKSRNLQNTTQLLSAANISLIWIDSAMREGQVWERDDEGLLFLLRNERFKRIYYKDGIEIWRFT